MFERYVLDCTLRIGVGLQERCANILDTRVLRLKVSKLKVSELKVCETKGILRLKVAIDDQIWSPLQL